LKAAAAEAQDWLIREEHDGSGYLGDCCLSVRHVVASWPLQR
jgi:hypothetical protein